ncbi:uncharacterized protein FIESC28_11315 [Fusarium coffeatum]|uniref:F-box domain-containing protein n=1 Tax=Fusarium coffeatum TaxID=231269 RepID=A0A366QLN7_9HYPO|nr:uncharacterized protein FIESC28_11315 [Fusarium coffeatum]RBR05652.1 hypothetical protein FIESC28_11315 [Fusarium coffeatum]
MIDLPDEIWHQIFANFEDYMPFKNWWMYGAQLNHESPRTLFSLSQVSRRFRRVAQSFLFRTLLLEGSDDQVLVQMLLLRTLSEDPKLGQHVRNVSLDDSTGSPLRKSTTLANIPVESILRKALSSLNLPPSTTKWLEKSISDGCAFGILAMAYMAQAQFVDCTVARVGSPLPFMLSGHLGLEDGLLSQPRVEAQVQEINHQDNDKTNDKHPSIVMGKMPKTYSFPNLTEVRIRVGGFEEVLPAFVIEPILLHPTLKTLRTFGIDWSGNTSRQLRWPDRVSNLRCLDLKESVIDANGLRSVLTRCPILKGLSIQLASWSSDQDREEGSWIVDLDDFGNVLRQFGRGLEEFDIHTLGYSSEHSTDGRLGLLQALSSLKHLKTDKEVLLGPVTDPDEEVGLPAFHLGEALPPSLETLYLHCVNDNYGEYWYERRRQIVNKEIHDLIIQDRLPDLREIQVERYYNETGEGEWDPDLKVEGWKISVQNEHLWETYDSSGCMRTILILSRRI